ncbi:MAG: DUF3426 domain-containing protein [Methylococcaceae bacterium]|nr:DUF3426 domain-containing protein [Methylococcaceae bacterium]
MYDALELLNEGTIPASIEAATFSSAVKSNTSKLTRYWGLAAGFLVMLFIFQVYFFEGYNLSQHTTFRPWLKKVCTTTTNCQLPVYKNLDEISILKGSFEPENDHYLFKTAVINQALFAQKRPSIKLTLTDFTGQSFATRIFYPTDYSKQSVKLLEPNLADEITLSIATPSSKVGGYRFELI